MTETIKNKHLELGLDALIDTKLANGGDPFQTLSKAKETFATKEELTSLISRIEALENKNQSRLTPSEWKGLFLLPL